MEPERRGCVWLSECPFLIFENFEEISVLIRKWMVTFVEEFAQGHVVSYFVARLTRQLFLPKAHFQTIYTVPQFYTVK